MVKMKQTNPPQHKPRCVHKRTTTKLNRIHWIDTFPRFARWQPTFQRFLSSILFAFSRSYSNTFFFHREYIISTSAYSLPPMNEQQNKKNNNKKLMKLNSIIECKIWMREKFIHFEHENNNRKFQRPRRRSEKKYSKIQFLFRFALKCERKEREKAIAHRENKAKSFDRWVFEKF